MIFTGKLDVQDAIDSLIDLSAGVQRSVMRPALRSAAIPMLQAVRAGLPGDTGYKDEFGVETGLLKESLDKIERTYPAKNLVMVVIGPRTGMKRTVQLDSRFIFRQVGGRRASKSAPGIFGRTWWIKKPRPDQLSRAEDPAKIAHFVEGGHKIQSNRKAYPFMKPAFEATKARSEAIFVERCRVLLDRLVVAVAKRRR